MQKKRRLLDEYRFPGFRPRAEIKGIFGDPRARLIRLTKGQKKQFAGSAGARREATTTRKYAGYETCPVGMYESTWKWRFDVYIVGSAGK
jgi:hypothetical protein